MTIYIGNIPYSINDQDLSDVFNQFGQVESSKVIVDKKTKRSKGYGFIVLKDPENESTAIIEMNGKDIGGRKVKVSEANPKKVDE
jgi:RNA recognition motif-containing protein